jgi:sec-independent protein translocase protein TatA
MVAMGSFSLMHWMLFGAVALLLFGGKGKISDIMGDVAKGIKSFKKGMSDEDEPASRAADVSTRAVEARAPVVTESRENQKVG